MQLTLHLIFYHTSDLLFSVSAEKSTVSMLFDHFDLTEEARWCFLSHAYVVTSLRTSIFFFFLYVLIIYIWITMLMYRDIFTCYIMMCCLLIVYIG
jgi:hypothetical protein